MLLYLLVQFCPRPLGVPYFETCFSVLCPLNSLSLSFVLYVNPRVCWNADLLSSVAASPRLSRKEKRFSFQANKREILADYALPVAVVTFR
jgi:hypothetical protein